MIVTDEAKAMDLACMAGQILLENGAELSRVEETMNRIADHYGVETRQFYLLTNGIFSTSGGRYAKVNPIPVKGSQFDKVEAVSQLSRDIVAGKYSIEEAVEKLEEIKNMKRLPKWKVILAAGFGSAAFSILFGGNFHDALVALFAGWALYIFVAFVGNAHLSKIFCNSVGSFIAAFVCFLGFHFEIGHHLSQMIIGAVMPLIPGVPFVNGIRDLTNGDYLSGLIRMMDAILIFICIAFGVSLALIIGNDCIGGVVL